MLCANCGTSNRDDEKFCRGCLQPLTGAPASASGSPFNPPRAALQDSADYAEFGGFFQRAAAVLIDGFILGLILIPAFGVAAFLGSPGLMMLLMFVAFIGGSAYYVLMESGERGATYGKRAMHLRVVDLNGEQISFGRALGRYLGHVLTNIVPFYLGYLMQPFTERKQALHDMVSGTIVVRTDEGGSNAGAIIIVGLFVLMVAGVGIAAAVAIPAYQDYVVKASKMAQVMQTGNTASKAVETFYAQAGRYPESMAETGAPLQKPAFISDIEVHPDTGEVELIFNDREPRSVAGKSISFKPTRYTDGSFVWACSSSEISPKLLPKDCK